MQAEFNEGGEESARRVDQSSGISQFGIMPYLMMFCEATNERLTDAMEYSLNYILYVVTYIVYKNDLERKELEKIRKRHSK